MDGYIAPKIVWFNGCPRKSFTK